MPVTVQHVRSLTQGEGTNTNLIGPNEWNSVHNVTISETGSAPPTVNFTQVHPLVYPNSIIALSASTVTKKPMLQPLFMDGTGLVPSTVRFLLSLTSANSSQSFIGTFQAAIYSQQSGTGSSIMSLITSDQQTYSVTTSGQFKTGLMAMDFTGMAGFTFSNPGQYAVAFVCNPGTADGSHMVASIVGGSALPAINGVYSNQTTGANPAELIPWQGIYTTTSAGMPASISSNQLSGLPAGSNVPFWAALKAY